MYLEQMIEGRKTRREIRAMVDMFEEVTKKRVLNQPPYNILGDVV